MKSKLTIEQRSWLQENDYDSTENAPAEFLSDKNFAIEVCKNNGDALQHMSFALRGD